MELPGLPDLIGACALHVARGAAACLLLVGCTVALRREHDQCQTSADCQALSIGAICTSEGICEAGGPSAFTGPALACQTDSDCAGALVACRDHACREFEQAGCRVIAGGSVPAGRESVPIGVLVPPSELADRSSYAVSQAVAGAIDEANAASNEPLPWLLAIACSEEDPSGLSHLLEQIQVSAVVGTTHADFTKAALSAIAGKAVLFAPFADAPSLAAGNLPASLVSCRANRISTKGALVTAIDSLGDQRSAPKVNGAWLAVSKVEDAVDFDALYADSAKVISYEFGTRGKELWDRLRDEKLAPDWIVAPSGEVDWSVNMRKVDGYLAQRPPSYLLSSKKLPILNAALSDPGASHPLYERVRVLDDHLSPRNLAVQAAYAKTLVSQLSAPTPGQDLVRDCAYLCLYAAYAAFFRLGLQANELRPVHFLIGLRALVQGEPLSVGESASVLDALERARGADGAVGLIGGSGDLDLSMPGDDSSDVLPAVETIAEDALGFYIRPSPRVQELFCIDPKSKQFCGTGNLFPAATLVAESGLGGCSCND